MRPHPQDWSVFGPSPHPDDALKQGDLQTALREFGFQQMMELRSPTPMYSDSPGVGFGTVLWLLGDYEGAGHTWAQITEMAYKGRYSYSNQKTFQGPLLLWFASVRLQCRDWHDLADRTLDKLLGKKYWSESSPAELALFLQKKADLAYVESKYKDSLRERQFPKAMFYAGVRALETGQAEDAAAYWDRVEPPKLPLWELEYYLAVHERKRLKEQAQ